MPKYLITATYTAEGAKGLLKDGGSKRRDAAEQALKSERVMFHQRERTRSDRISCRGGTARPI